MHAACYISVSKFLCTKATISAVQEQWLKVLSFPLGNTDEKALKPTPGNDKSRDSEDGGDDNMDVD